MRLIRTEDVLKHYPFSGKYNLEPRRIKVGLAIQIISQNFAVAGLCSKTAYHQLLLSARLDQLVILHDRFGSSKGLVVWANVSDSVYSRLCQGIDCLSDDGVWSSGQNTWIVLLTCDSDAFGAFKSLILREAKDSTHLGYSRLRRGQIVTCDRWKSDVSQDRYLLSNLEIDQYAPLQPYIFHSAWMTLIKASVYCEIVEALAAHDRLGSLSVRMLDNLLQAPITLRQFSWIVNSDGARKLVAWAWNSEARLEARLSTTLHELKLQQWNDGAVPTVMLAVPELEPRDAEKVADFLSKSAGRTIAIEKVALHQDTTSKSTKLRWLSELL